MNVDGEDVFGVMSGAGLGACLVLVIALALGWPILVAAFGAVVGAPVGSATATRTGIGGRQLVRRTLHAERPDGRTRVE